MRLLEKCIISIEGTIINLQFDNDPPINFDVSINRVDFNTTKNDMHISLHSTYYGISIAVAPENIIFNSESFTDMETAMDKISEGIKNMVALGNSVDYASVLNKPTINGIEIKSKPDDFVLPAMFWDIKE